MFTIGDNNAPYDYHLLYNDAGNHFDALRPINPPVSMDASDQESEMSEPSMDTDNPELETDESPMDTEDQETPTTTSSQSSSSSPSSQSSPSSHSSTTDQQNTFSRNHIIYAVYPLKFERNV